MPVMQEAKPIVDGFTYSLSRIPSASSYYQMAVAQLDTLRRANGYHMRVYNVPDALDTPIPAYGTLEYQVRTQPGAYLWAFSFCVTGGGSVDDLVFQATDACTESRLFSDYVLASSMAETASGIGLNRPPCLLSQPYLMGAPGLINVEISNRASSSRTCQLLLHFAEPSLPMGELIKLFERAGYKI